MNEIISWVFGKTADRIPSFILSRLYPSEKVAKQIRLNLRGDNPISLYLGAESPQVDMYFEITNLSNLKLTLDRLIIKVWFSQPTFEGFILERYKIPSREIVNNIHYRQSLNIAQKERIEYCQNHQGRIYIYLTAHFESKVGIIEVTNTIERAKL